MGVELELYRKMVRIRKFEERSLRIYQQGKIAGFLHLYIGQESVAVGAISAMSPSDHLIGGYRDHGLALAVGMDMKSCMAELTGRVTGASKGKGGSMHLFAPDKHFWGGHGIVAAQTPLGAGIAFALKYQNIEGACLCFLGDGTVNQGAFLESLNLAALWNLPVVFIIENNHYSMGTSQERSSAGKSLASRAEPFGMAFDTIEGNAVLGVQEAVQKALKRAHETQSPFLLECKTYRYRGHSVADPDKTYRSREEIADYKEHKDPIALFEKHLLSNQLANKDDVLKIQKDAQTEAEDAAEFAINSDFPPAADIFRHIYWEADFPEERNSQGTLIF